MARTFFNFSALVIFCILAASCQSSRPYYDAKRNSWATESPSLPAREFLEHTVFLVGDAGAVDSTPLSPSFTLLKHHLAKEGKKSSFVMLGDNIYPKGLSEKKDPKQASYKAVLNTQLNTFKGYEGGIFYVMGNHDWNNAKAGGRAFAQRQQEYIENYLAKEIGYQEKVVFPRKGCGKPKAIEIYDNLVIILIDSQWYLHPWEEEPGMNLNCNIQTKADFKAEMEELIDEYDDRNIIISMHHPLFTNGSHGGFFPFDHHLFPLTASSKLKYAFFPLPVIGSIHPIARYLGVSPQDLNHHKYQELKQLLLNVTAESKNIVFAAGHEHALQYFYQKDHHFVVSGSGSKKSYTKKGVDAEFLYSGYGLAKLYYYKDGSVWLEMLRPAQNEEGEVLFRKQLKGKSLSGKKRNTIQANFQNSKTIAADPIYEAKGFKKWALGGLYRDAWGQEVDFPVLNLDSIYGGLVPIQKGGGRQTQSLRLQAKNGKQYVLRSVKKTVSALLPDNLKGTVFEDVFQDLISVAHPYGAAVVPPLAEAVGVYHTNPQFFYVPKQAALGDFVDTFGDEVYLFEERPAKNREDVASFGNSKKIVSFRKLLTSMQKDLDYEIDEELVLRSRLFDIWIGDWDRRDDNWRWATFKEDGKTIYRPVPRDRDQVFVKTDGTLSALASQPFLVREIPNFDDYIEDVPAMGFNSRFFDRNFLVKKTENEWIAEAERIKSKLSDKLIEDAFKRWPKPIYDIDAASIIKNLKIRRDSLPVYAKEYYAFLSRFVSVVGSNERERFEISRLPDGKTKVDLYPISKKKGKKKELFYSRVFDSKHTNEIRLFGLKGDDQFVIQGQGNKASTLRIISGEGKDLIYDQSFKVPKRKTVVYEHSSLEDTIQSVKGVKLNIDQDLAIHHYDRWDVKYPTYLPLIIPGFNVDDGVSLGAGISWTKPGFNKKPYKSSHLANFSYAFETQAFKFQYTGDFIGVLGNSDFYLDFSAFAPSYVDNFFGLGNNSGLTEEGENDRDFNRLRYGRIYLFPAIKKTSPNGFHSLRIGPYVEYTNPERTEGRYVSQDIAELEEEDFVSPLFGGAKIEYSINASNNPFHPERGLNLNSEISWMQQLDDNDNRNHLRLYGDFAFYSTLYAQPFSFTLANKVGAGANFGEYYFYQAQTLGRRNNLRGFRGERFAGDAQFYHNIDLRIKLGKTGGTVMPLNLGILGFFDYGRVWLDNEESDKWHQGYGGGIWFSPYELVTFSATYSLSTEFDIFEFRLGFFF